MTNIRPVHLLAAAELELAIAHADFIETIEYLDRAFRKGSLGGEVGAVDLSGLSTTALMHFLEKSKSRSCKNPQVLLQQQLGLVIIDLRTAQQHGRWLDDNPYEFGIETELIRANTSLMGDKEYKQKLRECFVSVEGVARGGRM